MTTTTTTDKSSPRSVSSYTCGRASGRTSCAVIVGVVVTVIAVCRFADGSFGTSTPPLDHDNHELMHANASSSLFPNPFASPLLFESKHNLRFLVNQLERNQLGRVGSNNGSAGKSNTHPVTASEEDRQRTSGESEAPDYRRVGPDDDEIHDEEILKAVQRSLYEFYFNKMVRGGGVDDPTTGNSSEVRSRGKNDPHHRTRRGIKMVCYGVLGCFRDEGVFDYLDMVPASPDEINTRFFVYTRTVNAQHAPEVYDWDNYTSTSESAFNASRVTKIIVHGFGSTCNRMWASEMRQAMLAVVDCNVICVDWEAGAALPNYVRAAVNTRLVGKQLSLFVSALGSNHGARNEDVHLIGFSLGAHVAGFAGSELKNLSRITGLDPAGPLFEGYDAKVRLDASDAMFVDVIHSNGDSLLMGGLGSWEPIGNLDFYPNGGRAQKGCSHMFLGAFRDLIWSAPSSTGSSSSSSSVVASSSPSPVVSSASSSSSSTPLLIMPPQQPVVVGSTTLPPTVLQPPSPHPHHQHVVHLPVPAAAPPPPPPPSGVLQHKHVVTGKMRMRMLPMVEGGLVPPHHHHHLVHHHVHGHHHNHFQHHNPPIPPPPPPPTTTHAPETDGRSLCNHRRAYKFFTESVSPRCQFPAFFCESFDKYLTGVCFHGVGGNTVTTFNMGYYADVGWREHQAGGAGSPGNGKGSERASATGSGSGSSSGSKTALLYLATRDEEPFCANQYRIRVESSPSPAPISTYGGLEAIVIGESADDEDQHVMQQQLVNSTFLVTQTPKDNMVAGSVLQRLVVAHPALTNPVRISLKYTAYQGWLYSGISRWSMDRIVITDARGVSSSFCTRGLLLPSGISVTVTLTPGLCTQHPGPPMSPPPPNFPNYPYETFSPSPKSAGPGTRMNGGVGSGSSSSAEMMPGMNGNNTTVIPNSSSQVEYSEWQPIVLNMTVSGEPGVDSGNGSSYVTKQVLPHDIDNILSEHEVVGPVESAASLPTRMLLGTTRSLKSRPIVLRNHVSPNDPHHHRAVLNDGRTREGRGFVIENAHTPVYYYVPASKPTKHQGRSRGPSSSAGNEMRQMAYKIIQDSELGDVVALPPGRVTAYARGGVHSMMSGTDRQVSPKRSKSNPFGLVALRRRKKSGSSRRHRSSGGVGASDGAPIARTSSA